MGESTALQSILKERQNPKNGQLAKKEARLQASVDNLEKEVAEWERLRDAGVDTEIPDVESNIAGTTSPSADGSKPTGGSEREDVDLFAFYEKLSRIRTAVQLAQQAEAQANDQREKVFVLYESGAHRRDYLAQSPSTASSNVQASKISVEYEDNPKHLIQNLVAA